MPVNHYWEWTRSELNTLSIQNYSPQYKSPQLGDFQPGDFAYLEGNLHGVFCEFLERKHYQLSLGEDTPTLGIKGRYCIVLRRISLHKYIVCFCASYGGARGFQDITDPVARHFGIPLNENAVWPGLKPLKTYPRWKSAAGAFLLAIPVVREGLLPPNLNYRFRLEYSDFHRLQRLINDRSQSFDRYAQEIRAGHAAYMRSKLNNRARSPLEVEKDTPTANIGIRFPRSIPKPLDITTGRQNIRPLLEDMKRGVSSRSIYLNNLSLKRRRPILAKLPKPFFSSTLRTSMEAINRLLFR